MSSEGVIVRGLGHRYDEDWVFEEVNLEVKPGELVALLGESGTGKTTLLRAIAGFIDPTKGAVELNATTVAQGGTSIIATEGRGVGVVFQDHALFEHMSVAENIAFGLKGWGSEDAKRRVSELLEEVGLSDRKVSSPSTLSGGQRQRIALARALAPRPSVLLLDEPFASLDSSRQRALAGSVKHLVQRENVAALMVTHDAQAAMRWADRIAVLGASASGQSARLLQVDSARALYEKPRSRGIAEMFGECAFVQADATGQVAQCVLGEVQLVEPVRGPCLVIVRPEDVRFEERSGGPHHVVSVEYEGARSRLQVVVGSAELSVFTDDSSTSVGHEGQLIVTRALSSLAGEPGRS